MNKRRFWILFAIGSKFYRPPVPIGSSPDGVTGGGNKSFLVCCLIC